MMKMRRRMNMLRRNSPMSDHLAKTKITQVTKTEKSLM